MKESYEKLLQNIKVKVLNAEDGKAMLNENNEPIETQTDDEGNYSFELPKGKYIVCFEYDSENYEITSYQKNGVNTSKNSDVLNKKIDDNSETKEVALTDILELKESDIIDIDMGIKKTNVFDLSMEKQITKVTVQNEKETKTYNYDGLDLAMVQIDPEYYVGTTVIVEYTMTVTNEGDIEGYVNDIVDYLPAAFKFTSELNKDWYLSEDGKLHNNSLENEKVAAGESKEVKLILTKTIASEEETGRFSNTAEIAKCSNEDGIEDVDSLPNNKVTGEDDMSTASIIISVTTGKTLQYIFIVLLVITAISTTVYIINKKFIKLR